MYWNQFFGYVFVGPKFWGQTFQKCVGKHQSPIDIEEHDVTVVTLEPLVFENFDDVPDFYELENNGHTGASLLLLLFFFKSLVA